MGSFSVISNMHRPPQFRAVVHSGGDFVSRGHLAMSAILVGCHDRVEGTILPSSRQRPGVPWNVPQCTGQSPHQPQTHNYLAPMSMVLRLRNLVYRQENQKN